MQMKDLNIGRRKKTTKRPTDCLFTHDHLRFTKEAYNPREEKDCMRPKNKAKGECKQERSDISVKQYDTENFP